MAEELCPGLPNLPLYHPNSELRSRSGYYPNLSESQLKAISELEKMIKESGYQLNDPSETEHDLFKLLRFLRARNFNVNNAFQMLKNDIEWRSSENRQQLKQLTAAQVLECDLAQIFSYFPTWVQGVDKQCRPVAWRQFGKLEIWNVLKLVSMERLLQFHAWEAEQALRLMNNQVLATGYHIETFVVVIDAAGWHMGLATTDAFTFIRGMSSTDSDHYPERLGRLIVINAPTALSFVWRMVSSLLDEVTLTKINVFSARSDWLPVLLSLMDEDQIPAQYGGTAKDFTSEEALQSMDPPQLPPFPSKDEEATKISE